jgi:hypothetical protein
VSDGGAPSLADAFFLRTAPVRPGDAVPFHDESLGRARGTRALRQYDGGRLVVLLADGGAEAPSADWFAGLDSAMLWLHADGLPVLRRTLHDWTPVTSPAAGQFYVVLDPTLRAFGVSGLASSYQLMDGVAGVPTMVFVDPGAVRTAAATYTLLAHELTHAFQYQYLRAAAPGDLWTYRTQWAQEGTADLVAYELLRRHVGLPLLGNAEWGPVGTDGPGLLAGLLYVNGRFRDGYRQSASFLFDLYARRVRGGEPLDAALRDVTRGALDSWHGVQPGRPGLVARMTGAIGAPWDPVDALLTWTLSQAVDDRTSNPRFQNAMFRQAWRRPPRLTTWEPLATLGDGAGPVRVRQQGGGGGYLLVGGATLQVTSSVPSLHWMLVRYE